MVYIYVLKLQNGKWYVGKTENPQFRLESHFTGDASSWTNTWKPVSIHKVIPNCDAFDEDKYVIKYMSQYGIDNVRGGSFAMVELNVSQRKLLQQMITSATDKCFNCGLVGHFAKDCQSAITDSEESESDEYEEYEEIFYVCEWCDREFDSERECIQHEDKCKSNSKQKNKRSSQQLDVKKGACFRCGRTSHYAPACSATTHVDGYELD